MYNQDFSTGRVRKAEIERIDYKLSQIQTVDSIEDEIKEINERYDSTMFTLRESTGQGNYTDPETWTVGDIEDYIKRKNKQIAEAKAKNK